MISKIIAYKVVLVVLFCFIFLTGCGLGKKNVLFATKTSLGIDIDSKPPTIDIGYSRKEGTFSPKFKGGVLPQLSNFSFKTGLVNTAVGQSIATGNAAVIMGKYLGTELEPGNLGTNIETEYITGITKSSVKGKVADAVRYFFGTDTSFGLKLTFGLETGGYPDSLSLGYKRKEYAYVPIIEISDKVVALPSLIATASLDTDKEATFNQFYATGVAASYLAANPQVRNTVGLKIIRDQELREKIERYNLDKYIFARGENNYESIKKRYSALDDTKKVQSFNRAIELGLIEPSKSSINDQDKISTFKTEIAITVGQNKETNIDKLKQLHRFMLVL